MKQTKVRVVPDYINLSKALQRDMLQAAQHIRNALYDHPRIETLAIALIALDFPQFIPIENSTEALIEEHNHLTDLWFEQAIFSDEWMNTYIRLGDLEAEIQRRGGE